MTDKAKRGTKRVCGSCSAKFYDLNKEPATCPICETVFTVEKNEPKPKSKPKPKVKEKIKPEKQKEADSQGDQIFEDEDDLIDIESNDEIISSDDDDTFLEVEDEPESAVAATIPGVGNVKEDDS